MAIIVNVEKQLGLLGPLLLGGYGVLCTLQQQTFPPPDNRRVRQLVTSCIAGLLMGVLV